jgi:hypothetical protein
MQVYRTTCRLSFLFLVVWATGSVLYAQSPQTPLQPSTVGRNELLFVENRGQIHDTKGALRSDIVCTMDAGEVEVYFSGRTISYVFREFEHGDADGESATMLPLPMRDRLTRVRGHRMDLELIGANPRATITPEEPAAVRTTYLTSAASDGIRNVRSFRRLTYRDIYPNIDLVFYTGVQGLKYDFIVHPGGKVADIQMRYVAGDAALSGDGTLIATNPLGAIREDHPLTWQPTRSSVTVRKITDTIASGWRMDSGTIGFAIAAYDSSRTLVIDPGVAWSTYCGGSGDDFGYAVTTDMQGNIYVAGYTASTDFPAIGSFQLNFKGGSPIGLNSDAFAMKLDRNGQRLWATYIGGGEDEKAQGIAVDRSGNVVVTGFTSSTDFPIQGNPFQKTLRDVSADSGGDAFLMKIDAEGNLLWSTFFGGQSRDGANAVAIDSSDDIVIVGGTSSADFPVSSDAFQPKSGGPPPGRTTYGDMFVAKFGPEGAQSWATYYGGNAGEVANGVAIDLSGNVVVVGYTIGGTFQTTPGALKSSVQGQTDGAILKFDRNGQRIWCTLYGGNDQDQVNNVTVMESGEPVVIGMTNSLDFPTTNGSTHAGTYDMFLLKLDAAGGRIWSGLYGGQGGDVGYAVAYDRLKNMIVASGYTSSVGFRVTSDAPQSVLAGSNDGFVMQVDKDGGLFWSTFLGGTGFDVASAVAVDNTGTIVVCGYTVSKDFPKSDQTSLKGSYDAFITSYGCVVSDPITITGDTAACTSVPALLVAPPGYAYYRWSNGSTTQTSSITAPGVYSVVVADAMGCSGQSKPFNVRPAVNVHIDAPDSLIICPGDSITLGVTGNGGSYVTYLWSNGSTTPFTTVTEPGPYTVTVLDTTGCSGTSLPVIVTLHQPAPAPMVTQCGFRLTASPGVDYQWFSNGQPVAGSTGRDFTAPGFGLYSVRVMDTNGCRTMSAVYNLAPETISTTDVALPAQFAAEPGEPINVPILLTASHLFDPVPTDFTVILRYNRKLLYAIDSGATVVIAPDGERLTSITRRWSGTGDTLAVLHFLTLLGDTVTTPLQVESFAWKTECPVVVGQALGADMTLMLCQLGGSRLLRQGDTPGLKPVYPNPVRDQLLVEYDLLEHGTTSLYLVDASGKRMTTLFDGQATPGKHAAMLDARHLADGLYFIVLETPTDRFSQGVVVEK